MRAAHLLTICASVATRCQHWSGGSSSEQVWIGFQSWPPDVTSRRGSSSEPVSRGSLYSEVWCVVVDSHTGPPSPEQNDGHDRKHCLQATSLADGNQIEDRSYLPSGYFPPSFSSLQMLTFSSLPMYESFLRSNPCIIRFIFLNDRNIWLVIRKSTVCN